MGRRALATALSVAICVVLATPAVAGERDSGSFIDDDGIPAERALEWLADAGVLDGCDPPANRRICPDRILTRAEASKVLMLLGRHPGTLGAGRPPPPGGRRRGR